MESIVNLENLFHRSKKRIKDLGEVFTPEKFVEDMLDLISDGKKNYWSSEERVFFEPCCGHGNIVLAIYRRRLDAIYKKVFKEYSHEAPFYAVANSLDTLWAIDIDEENVNSCRSRVLFYTLEFLREKTKYDNYTELVESNIDYFAHIISAIGWHISVNETLSALSVGTHNKHLNTKTSEVWIKINGAQEVEFSSTWSEFYIECEENDVLSLEYEKSVVLLESILQGRSKNVNHFPYTKILKDLILKELNDELKEVL